MGAAGPLVSGPTFWTAAVARLACPATTPKDEAGPSILKGGRLPRSVAKPSGLKVKMAPGYFPGKEHAHFTYEGIPEEATKDMWETSEDYASRVWISHRRRFAFMCRPTPGYKGHDGRPGNVFIDGERAGIPRSYVNDYSTLAHVAARSRALSLSSEVHADRAPEQPVAGEDLRPAVGRTSDGGWI